MIELTDEEIGRSLAFSYTVTERTAKYYKMRNKYASTEKLIFDHFLAKLSEIVVFKHFQKNEYKVSYPSFKLEYDASEASDIYIIKDGKEIRVHCKVCRHDSPVTNSWLIQKNTINTLNENDYFAFTIFHSPKNIEIVKIISSQDIIWREPKMNLPSKMACYLEDMI